MNQPRISIKNGTKLAYPPERAICGDFKASQEQLAALAKDRQVQAYCGCGRRFVNDPAFRQHLEIGRSRQAWQAD